MKVCVQCASKGSRENTAATIAASGASRSTLQPLNASQIRRPKPTRMPRSPTRSERVIDSDLREQNVEIGGRPLAEGVAMLEQKGLAATTALFLQHRQERVLSVELRRSPELGEPVRYDPMRPHPRPSRAFPRRDRQPAAGALSSA